MIAKMKCSSCGAEMSNISMNWGRRYWLFTLPIMLLGFYPLFTMTFLKGDFTKELSISDVQKRYVDKSNSGSHNWKSLKVKAEFYNAEGAFVDEADEYISSDIAPGAKEHFKIKISNPTPEAFAPTSKMVVKVSSAMTMPF